MSGRYRCSSRAMRSASRRRGPPPSDRRTRLARTRTRRRRRRAVRMTAKASPRQTRDAGQPRAGLRTLPSTASDDGTRARPRSCMLTTGMPRRRAARHQRRAWPACGSSSTRSAGCTASSVRPAAPDSTRGNEVDAPLPRRLSSGRHGSSGARTSARRRCPCPSRDPAATRNSATRRLMCGGPAGARASPRRGPRRLAPCRSRTAGTRSGRCETRRSGTSRGAGRSAARSTYADAAL